jgi:biopolymer transport protein ExbB
MPRIWSPMREGRLRAWGLACLAWLLTVIILLQPLARAQEEKKGEPPPANAANAAGGTTAPTVEAQRGTMLSYLLKAHSDPLSAFIGLLLLGLSIYFVAQVIRLSLEYRVKEAVPPALIDRLEAAIRDKKFQEAYDACRDDNSFLARLVRTGIANLPNGRPEAKEAMNTAAEEMVVSMESRISYLATVGTLGPMIGLVGTIWGMIRAFQEIATTAGAQVRADQVAGAIATALFITLEGISLSTPAIFFFNFFRNRIAEVAMEATKVADRTIAAFWTAAKTPATTSASVKA